VRLLAAGLLLRRFSAAGGLAVVRLLAAVGFVPGAGRFPAVRRPRESGFAGARAGREPARAARGEALSSWTGRSLAAWAGASLAAGLA
jgi:hypothetical protein